MPTKESLKDKLTKQQQAQSSKDTGDASTSRTGDDMNGVDPRDKIKLKQSTVQNGGGRSVRLLIREISKFKSRRQATALYSNGRLNRIRMLMEIIKR